MANYNAKLNYNDQTIELPVYSATLGSPVIDVTSVNKYEVFTYDPGFLSTASCESKITYIDGDQGILLYRGYPIDQLTKKCSFMEVAQLLLFGELPDAQQNQQFADKLASRAALPAEILQVYKTFNTAAHPMGMLLSAVSALSAYHDNTQQLQDREFQLESCYDLLAIMPTLAGLCYKPGQDIEIPSSSSSFDYAERFLQWINPGVQQQSAEVSKVILSAFDKILTLHADHEQNASTSTVRMAGSTGTNPYAAIAAGIAALWGPAHGGANEACLNMLVEIGDESRIEHYIERAKDKNDPFRLMGFGHRVYKNYDPRATVMRETCHEVLNALGVKESPLFKLAMKLEKIALEDPYFIERKLYPNVDFYSGITLNALGIPTNMFTVIFVLARVSGWLAHWVEMLNDSQFRIARPRQLYTGPTERNVP